MPEVAVTINGIDRASPAFKRVQGAGQKAANAVKANWGKITMAAGAAAAGIETLGRKAAGQNEEFKKLAATTALNETAVRKLAAATSYANQPMSDTIELFKAARDQGLTSADAMQKFTNYWDKVGDAAGESGPQLARAGASLAAMGITADNATESQAALAYIMSESNMKVGEFLKIVGRVGPELDEMGLGINKSTAILSALEKKYGDSRVAQKEFRQAVNSADGDLDALYKQLGITEEQVGKLNKKVEESAPVMDKMAKASDESRTVMDKLKDKFNDLIAVHGEFLQSLTNLTPALIVIGPMLKGIVTIVPKLAGVITGSLIPALSAVAGGFWAIQVTGGPILWIIEAIIAAVALLVVAWVKDWGGIQGKTKAVIEWIGDKLTWLYDFIKAIFGAIGGAIKDAVSFIGSILKKGVGAYFGLWETVLFKIYDFVTNIFGKIVDWIKGLGGKMYDAGKNILTQIWEGIKSKAQWLIDKVKWVAGKIRDLWPFSPAKEGPLKDLQKGGENISRELAKGVSRGAPSAINAAKRLAVGIQTHLAGIGFRSLLKTSTFMAGFGSLTGESAGGGGGGDSAAIAAAAGNSAGSTTITKNYNNKFNISENIFESETKLRKAARELAPYIEEEKSR